MLQAVRDSFEEIANRPSNGIESEIEKEGGKRQEG